MGALLWQIRRQTGSLATVHGVLKTTAANAARKVVQAYRNQKRTPRERLVDFWKDRLDGDHGLRLDYPLTEESVVVDVGGYKGQWASDIYGRFSCHVHVFEPMPGFADLIEQRFAHNSKVIPYRYGLGASDRWVQISVDDDASSMIATAEAAETVEIRSAVDAVRTLGEVDLMKLNIEGAEYELLEALDAADALRQVRYVQVQFHDFVADAHARWQAARASLGKTHDLTWGYDFVWESWERRAS